MTIHINKQFKIEIDSYNHTLYEYKIVKNKQTKQEEEKWVSMEKYFKNVHDALVWLTQHRAGLIDYSTLSLYVKELNSLWASVEHLRGELH